ncbi:DUF4189 domain-containing protein [Hoeflea ulvae]|uniref:DUF4189 domain-containing protein n=1 Tax=Hoeflea ulvae TaxID=2983764 RepID=A0ABT3YGY2_9HYPH|nr:DUF4189 domain-containing protein [Hoeflea ulvae]MCY0095088.1 DUF4189 domain-containing protein [Hoeflea ulvae]
MRQQAASVTKRLMIVSAVIFMTSAASHADNFGAIAFSQSSGAYGTSYDYSSRRDAENRAMTECRTRSRGCKVAIWFRNACGAVATGANGWGSAWAGNRQQAERAAKQNCSKHTNGCRTLAWSCTSR